MNAKGMKMRFALLIVMVLVALFALAPAVKAGFTWSDAPTCCATVEPEPPMPTITPVIGLREATATPEAPMNE